jgi:hypothetical protein
MQDPAIPTTQSGKPTKPLGVVWYADQAAYAAVCALCADLDPGGYTAWREAAEEALATKALGLVPRVAVGIDAEALGAWCTRHRVVPNGAARSRFVLERVEAAFDKAWKAWKAGKKTPRRAW